MKIYCSCCDKVQSVRIDNCRDEKTNEPFQYIVCAECDLVIASGTDIAQPEQKCWCTTCRPITMADMRFVVCPDCGNKRCPKANDHRNACTNSNEIKQKGSSWEHVKPLAQPEQEPVAMKFKIYKPTVPDPMRQGINNALLPWVYDQDRSSGFDASMWVTPVATLPPQRTWVGLTDVEWMNIVNKNHAWFGQRPDEVAHEVAKLVEAKLKEKNCL